MSLFNNEEYHKSLYLTSIINLLPFVIKFFFRGRIILRIFLNSYYLQQLKLNYLHQQQKKITKINICYLNYI